MFEKSLKKTVEALFTLNKEKVISKLSCLCLDFMNDFNFNCYVKMFHCTERFF